MSFDNIYQTVNGFLPSGFEWLGFIIASLTLAFIVINAVVMSGAFYTWFERRVLGKFQSRLGPNRWGPFGLLQPIADVIKAIFLIVLLKKRKIFLFMIYYLHKKHFS